MRLLGHINEIYIIFEVGALRFEDEPNNKASSQCI